MSSLVSTAIETSEWAVVTDPRACPASAPSAVSCGGMPASSCPRPACKTPQRPFVRGENPRRPAARPAHFAERNGSARACTTITALSRHLDDEHSNQPQALLEKGPPPGSIQWGHWPVGWRTSSPDAAWRCPPTTPNGSSRAAATPHRRRPRTAAPPHAVDAFHQRMLQAQDRARRAGRPAAHLLARPPFKTRPT
jgi:hypothetical protein